MELKNAVVAITGAARGIGFEVARRLAQAGAKVAISDINEAGALAAAAAIREAGGEALGTRCNLASDQEVDDWARATLEQFGRADLLINNAAAQHVGPGNIDHLDFDHYRESFEVNMLGNLRTVRAFLPGMLERGSGYIINTASSLIIRPNGVIKHLMPYVTSKGAVLSNTWALAYAMKDRGIKVSLFCPGLTSTQPKGGGTKPNANGWFDGVRPDLTLAGTMEFATDTLLAGIRDEPFLISSEPDYEASIIRFAQHGLDPLSNYW